MLFATLWRQIVNSGEIAAVSFDALEPTRQTSPAHKLALVCYGGVL